MKRSDRALVAFNEKELEWVASTVAVESLAERTGPDTLVDILFVLCWCWLVVL